MPDILDLMRSGPSRGDYSPGSRFLVVALLLCGMFCWSATFYRRTRGLSVSEPASAVGPNGGYATSISVGLPRDLQADPFGLAPVPAVIAH